MDPLTDITTAGSAYRAVQVTGTPAVRTAQPAEQADAAATKTGKGIQLPEDQVTLSGQKPAADQQASQSSPDQPQTASATPKEESKPAEKSTADGKSSENDPQVQAQISRLKQNEEKVKAHEAAHKAAGGNLASSASYSYTKGPDGRSYISGGEVQIDMSDGNTPEETIARMQQVIRAALAPADPSGQDRSVAAAAASRMAQAQQEKVQSGDSGTSSGSGEQPEQTSGSSQAASTTATTDIRIRNAYGDPAVQASDTGSTGLSAVTQRQSGNSAGTSQFSSFA